MNQSQNAEDYKNHSKVGIAAVPNKLIGIQQFKSAQNYR